ncbi:MAG: hypothetical protein LBL26_13230 [Peptococcaceae bacterium]|nr:hypothetical protein [Peptococcaceae bacterium]
MAQALIQEEEIMTDFQFRALMALVLSIVRKSKSLEEVEKELQALADGTVGQAKKDDETQKNDLQFRTP